MWLTYAVIALQVLGAPPQPDAGETARRRCAAAEACRVALETPAATPGRSAPPERRLFSRDQPPSGATPELLGESASRVRRRYELGWTVFGDAGRVPGIALGTRLELTTDISRYFEVLAHASFLPSRNQATVIVDSGTGGATFGLASAGAGVCQRSDLMPRFTGRLCLGGDVTATTATGFDVADNAKVTEWGGAAWLESVFELHLFQHFALILEQQLLVALRRPSFELPAVGQVYRPGRVGYNLGVGVEVVF